MGRQRVVYTDESGDRKNFTMIPNMIYELDLSAYAISLYGAIKRTAGEQGTCWRSVATLAKMCGMGAGSVVRARKELEKNGLISVEHIPGERGGWGTVNIKIVDVWMRNALTFATNSTGEQASSTGELDRAPWELASSQGETKNIPNTRKTHKEVVIDNNNTPPDGGDYGDDTAADLPFRKLLDTFCNASGLSELVMVAHKWVPEIDLWQRMDATPEDIQRAVTILRDKRYSINSPKSITNTLNGVIAERKTPAAKPAKVGTYLGL